MNISGVGTSPAVAPPIPGGSGGTGTVTSPTGSTSAPLGGPTSSLTPAANLGGAGGGAVKGVSQLGGASDQMLSTLRTLADTLAKLAKVLEGMVAGAKGGGPSSGCSEMGGEKGKVAGMAGVTPAAPVAMANPVVGSPSVTTGANGKEDHAYEQAVLNRVNAVRQQHGLRPVTFNALLDTAAERHNQHQVKTDSMAHIGIGDGDPGSRIRAAGFGGQWGENVAVGQRTPDQVVNEWMNSPTHRANILNPNFRQMGVSYGTTSDGFPYWTQSFGN